MYANIQIQDHNGKFGVIPSQLSQEQDKWHSQDLRIYYSILPQLKHKNYFFYNQLKSMMYVKNYSYRNAGVDSCNLQI